jgi:N-acetylmuramoyl-L-alanine amidase
VRVLTSFVIDGGHDLNTKGKSVATMKEFEFNKSVANYTVSMLSNYENVKTYLSHNMDDGLDQSLESRTDLANKLKVDAYISIHADAFSSKDAKGETVFIYTKTGQSTLNLANTINKHLKEDLSISNRGVKRADFHVLRETTMDAVLIEFGFMTNSDDLALLKSDSYRRKCALMLTNALVEHFKLVKKKVLVKPPTQSNEIYRVVAGSFTNKENADRQVEKLKVRGFTSFIEVKPK